MWMRCFIRRFLIQCLLLMGALLFPKAEERPNILFAIADDWSYGHAGAYGCDWVRTPNFDQLAKEGLLFQRAYTPNAKCAPSRAIILTGRYSWQLENAGNHMTFFPAKFGSWIELLEDNGYATGYTGKGWGPGYAKDINGNNRKITGTAWQSQKTKPPAKAISNNNYSANFAEFLKATNQDKEKPWVFWYGTTEPHRGYEYGVGRRMGKKLKDIDRVPKYWPDNEVVRNDMLDYSIEVEHYDRHLGEIIALLKKNGKLDNTLIVATSDHGMPFPRVKGQAYEASNHIPLAIRWPKGINGRSRVITDYVSFADLAPTFIEAAGVNEITPIMQSITGQSLLEIFRSPKSGRVIPSRDHVLIGKERHDIGRPNNWGYPIRGMIKEDLLYLYNFKPSRWPSGHPLTGYLNCDGSPTKTTILSQRRNGIYHFWNLNFGKRQKEEFFDLTQDVDCINNLAKSERHFELKEELKEELFAELREQGDPRMFGKGDVFDNYPYSGKLTDNFYQRYTSGEKIRAGWVSPDDFEKEKLD